MITPNTDTSVTFTGPTRPDSPTRLAQVDPIAGTFLGEASDVHGIVYYVVKDAAGKEYHVAPDQAHVTYASRLDEAEATLSNIVEKLPGMDTAASVAGFAGMAVVGLGYVAALGLVGYAAYKGRQKPDQLNAMSEEEQRRLGWIVPPEDSDLLDIGHVSDEQRRRDLASWQPLAYKPKSEVVAASINMAEEEIVNFIRRHGGRSPLYFVQREVRYDSERGEILLAALERAIRRGRIVRTEVIGALPHLKYWYSLS